MSFDTAVLGQRAWRITQCCLHWRQRGPGNPGFSPMASQPAAAALGPRPVSPVDSLSRKCPSTVVLPRLICVFLCFCCSYCFVLVMCVGISHIYCLLSLRQWHLGHWCLLHKFSYSGFFISLCLLSHAFGTLVQDYGLEKTSTPKFLQVYSLQNSGVKYTVLCNAWGMG